MHYRKPLVAGVGPRFRKSFRKLSTESSIQNTVVPSGNVYITGIKVLAAGLTDIILSIVLELYCEKVCGKDNVDWKRISGMGRLFIRRLRTEIWLFRVVLKWSLCGGGPYTGVWSYSIFQLALIFLQHAILPPRNLRYGR